MVGDGSRKAVVAALRTAMPDGDGWLAGPAFSAADVYVGGMVDWGLAFGMLPGEPAFLANRDRLSSRAAFHRAQALDAELAAAMAG